MPYKDRDRQREYQRERRARIRRAWARIRRAWLEENGPCRRCGSTVRLELDHIDPDGKVDHKVWSWAPARRERELAKCQVLCRDCHRDKSASEKATGQDVGTSALTNEQAARIRRDYGSVPIVMLARRYGVHRSTIWRVATGRTYAA